MSETNDSKAYYPEAEVRRKKSFSLVWLIPIIAIVVGAVMAVQAIVTKGPLITISFSRADGLVAGKTQVRYKNVTVGLVETVHLSDDLSSVIVEARMDNSIKPYLLDTTQFWIRTAKVTSGEISGLSTLLSGAYIGMDPGSGTKSASSFTARDTPPVVTTGLPGRHFFLDAETLGSINIKSPIYYRQIKVGEVVSFQLKEDGSGVQAQIFINEPFDKFVKTSSRFWNASGINLKLDAKGISVNTESITSVLSGGIAFETPVGFGLESKAKEGAIFSLFRNHEASKEKSFSRRNYYFVYFPYSVRGLEPGAPVEFLGFKVGEVVDLKLELNVEKVEFKAPVLFYIEPERIHILGDKQITGTGLMDEMVRRGMRVQLKNGNLLTGKLYVDLVIQDKAPAQEIDYSLAYPRLPTIPSDVEAITSSVQTILDNLKQVKFQRIESDLHKTLTLLNSNLERTDKLIANMNTATMPQIETALTELQSTMNDLRVAFGSTSDFNQDSRLALTELAEAARSIKTLTDYLANHPESLLRGKD